MKKNRQMKRKTRVSFSSNLLQVNTSSPARCYLESQGLELLQLSAFSSIEALVGNPANGEPDTFGGHQKGRVNLVQFLKQENDPLSSTMVNFLPFPC